MEGKNSVFNIKILLSYSPLQEPIPILCEDLVAFPLLHCTEWDAEWDVQSDPIWIKHQNLVPTVEDDETLMCWLIF